METNTDPDISSGGVKVYSRAEIAGELLSQRFQKISFFATETRKFKFFNRLKITSKIKKGHAICTSL
jgi:hypothetical protein